MKREFPWDELMHFGIGTLHLAPHEFWRSTLRELTAARGLLRLPLLRQNLIDLMLKFPDDP
jgi:uncharacterized phage protein (TIGR02216 family)